MRIIAAGLLALSLAACQITAPFGGGKATAPEPAAPNTGAPNSGASNSGASNTGAPNSGAANPAKPAPAGAAIPSGTLKSPAAPPPGPAKAEPIQAPAEPAEKAPPKPPEQLLCEGGGGLWSEAGLEGIKTCVQRTRDAGKSCKRESDCEGLCLARSRSCAPIKPLFGCNDILQADGRQVTLCID